MAQPLISLLHPTARVKPSESFPRGWRQAFDLFLERADHPENIEYVLAVHESRWNDFWDNADSATPWVSVMGFCKVTSELNNGRDCVVDQINCAAAASSGKLLVGIMDDQEPPEHWDTLVLEALITAHGEADGLAFDGEYVIDLTGEPAPHIIYGAITRKRYERYGYILNPAFESMYADNFLTYQARQDEAQGLCKIIDARHLGFKHRRMVDGKTDHIYALQNRQEAYQQGHATFCKLVANQRVVAVCSPGEVYRHEWVAEAFRLMMHIQMCGRFSSLANHWAHQTNVHSVRMELANSVLTASPRADLVLWIDDDNILSPAHFDLLVADLDQRPDLAGIVGWCWCDPGDPTGIKNEPLEMSCGRQAPNWLCKRFSLDDWNQAKDLDQWILGPDEIAPDAFWSGFPVVLMRYEALEKLGAKAFLPIIVPEVRNGFTSEDTSFFFRANEAGLKFAVDLRVKVPHLKVRSIEPSYIPERERDQAQESQGKICSAAAD